MIQYSFVGSVRDIERRHSRIIFASALVLVLLSDVLAAAEPDNAVARGRNFLASLFDEELNLLPEYNGAEVYWLYHDNYLAAKVLHDSHPTIAAKIKASTRAWGERKSGKIEILFNEATDPLPFRQYVLVEIGKQGRKTIRSERTTEDPMEMWEAYADLQLFAAIALSESDGTKATEHFRSALMIWDGIGFDDPAKRDLGVYATYKLALCVCAATKLNLVDELPPTMVSRLKSLQHDSGGWITDYKRDGTPIGKANVETTCLAVIALQAISLKQ